MLDQKVLILIDTTMFVQTTSTGLLVTENLVSNSFTLRKRLLQEIVSDSPIYSRRASTSSIDVLLTPG